MDPFKSNIDHLTPEIMEKYLAGTLSKEECYEVEKLIADSDFESEAMEGYENTAVSIEQDLSQLNRQLTNRIQEEKKVFPLWFKIAASILLLAVSTFFVVTYDFTDADSSSELAQNDQKETNEPPGEESEPNTFIEEDTLIALNQTEERQEAESSAAREKMTVGEPKSTISENKEEVEILESIDIADTEGDMEIEGAAEFEVEADEFISEVETEEVIAPVVTAKEKAETQSSPPSPSESLRKAKRRTFYDRSVPTSSFTSKKVKGKVTSAEDGEALPGVNIVLKGTAIGTVTDMDGNYSIDIPNNDQNALVASFIGLNAIEVEVGSESEVDIQLAADVSQLSEVVVTGYGIASRSAEEPKTIVPARPEGGKPAYKKYLEQNITIPSDSLTGKVIVRFDVLPDGSLSNLSINKSPGPQYEAEAIRLIKEGPKWLPATENDSAVTDQVKVRVRFK